MGTIKMKDLTTGEEREVTVEEFQRALSQADSISVQQVRTDARGVEHVTDLFGGGDDDEVPFWQGGTAPSEEAAQRRREENARKAKAEAELEAWRKEQEEKDKAYRKWSEEWKKWADERDGVLRNRDREYHKKRLERRQELTREAGDSWNRTKKSLEGEKTSAEAEKTGAEAEKAAAETALAGLGFFQFSEKKQYKELISKQGRTISESTAKLREVAKRLETAEQEYKKELEGIDAAVLSEEAALKQRAEAAFPMPRKPSIPQSREFIEHAILDAVGTWGMTLSQIKESIPALEDSSDNAISNILRTLYLNGLISRETNFRGSYVYSRMRF